VEFNHFHKKIYVPRRMYCPSLQNATLKLVDNALAAAPVPLASRQSRLYCLAAHSVMSQTHRHSTIGLCSSRNFGPKSM